MKPDLSRLEARYEAELNFLDEALHQFLHCSRSESGVFLHDALVADMRFYSTFCLYQGAMYSAKYQN